ncbi:craniofacial development protein 2-like [Strongylocentrotus purpuratus]|uniref:Endonuclease/exonuclease/phosphatase domain-containing protein n=1 Tax=Strongylocentrotus purpuratus TaxID=7668 RepID=A0A7M7SYK6_STRPU|nr:craniofacial development protein 2-like [Strongylocentrotus purpuratus]
MKVVPPLRPRVPVAACWQQRGRGAKNLPDDLLPIPQVHNVAEKNSGKRSTSTEENTMKKKKKKNKNNNAKGVTAPSNSVSTQKKDNHRPRTDKVHDMTKDATSQSSHNTRKSGVLNIGTWNVRTLKKAGHWDILLEEARRFDLDILGLCETHLTGRETLINKEEYSILLSSRKDNTSREGVGIMISQQILHCLVSYEAVSPRIITAKFNMEEEIMNIIQVYAPTSAHSEQESDLFYDALQLHIQKVPRKENIIVMGDLNAKVGADHGVWAPTLGKFGLGQINRRGEKLLEFCMLHGMAVCNTYFQHKECRRATWTSPGGHYRNQIDFIITKLGNIKTFQNCRSYCSADIGSDHNLVLANVKFSPTKTKRMKSLPKTYDVGRFNDSNIVETFKARIGGAFEPLLQLPDTDVDELWKKFRDTTNNISEEIVGFKRSRQVKGLPEEVCKACEQRRKARILMMNNPSDCNKKSYTKLNKAVKYEVKKWKKKILDTEVEEMELAHAKNNSH